MRVLLPLRKVSANKSSCSSDSEGEGPIEVYTNSDGGELQVLRLAETQQLEASLEEAGAQAFDILSESKPPAISLKTTGLESAPAVPVVEQRIPSPILRKRRSEGTDAAKFCKKRPALDKKPPARDLSNHSSMVGGGRLRYYDDSHREAPEPMENNPASARGDVDERDVDFAVVLKKRGLEIREQDGDGNCLFRAVGLQVYGDPSMHGDVRKNCMDFMDRDQQHFSQFVTGEPFSQYIQRKRQDGVHGNHTEIQAISELFNRPVELFCPENGATPLNIFHAEYKTNDAPIRLSYHDGNHYNAVVDPFVPTAGLGLGLPGLQPGLADQMQMAKAVAESDAAADQMELKRAVKESEDDELQRSIKESKLSAEHMHSHEAMALSDMDATYFELEQAALEQSLQSIAKNEQGKKQKASVGRRRKQGKSVPAHFTSTSEDGPRASILSQQKDGPNTSDVSPQSAVASLPSNSEAPAEASIPPVAAAASVASAASASAVVAEGLPSRPLGSVDEYPQTVQELVMNGFDLKKVVRAHELIGDNFDDLLAFLMSNTG